MFSSAAQNRTPMCPVLLLLWLRYDARFVSARRGRLRAARGCLRAGWRRRRVGSPTLRIAGWPAAAGRDEVAASVTIQSLRFGLVAARCFDLTPAVAHEILALVAAQALAA